MGSFTLWEEVDHVIASPFSHYQHNVPKRELKPPAWNFNLALHYLNGPPFEPLGEANLRDLTTKAVFLLGFALGARICEIHGLSGRVVFGRKGISAVLTYGDQFWLKMVNALEIVETVIVLPSLYDRPPEREKLLSCPVGALQFYCQRKGRA